MKEGQLVRRGQKLVQLERYFLELELTQQRAAREAAQSELELSREKYDNARRQAESRMKEIEKQETLLKKLRAEMDKMRATYEGKQVLFGEGGVSKEEFETIKTELIGREAAYRMAQKDLEIISVGFRRPRSGSGSGTAEHGRRRRLMAIRRTRRCAPYTAIPFPEGPACRLVNSREGSLA